MPFQDDFLYRDDPRVVDRLEREGRPVEGAVEVVKSKAAELASLIMTRAREEPTQIDRLVVLMPKAVSVPPPRPVDRIFPVTIVPMAVRAPTARLVSQGDSRGGDNGYPWTAQPPSMFFAAPALGAMMVMAGKQVLLWLAVDVGIEIGESGLLEIKKRVGRRDIDVRFQTGKSAGGEGNVVKPRGVDGAPAEGTSPYDDPDNSVWWQPWTWA